MLEEWLKYKLSAGEESFCSLLSPDDPASVLMQAYNRLLCLQLHLVHIRALVSLYQTPTNALMYYEIITLLTLFVTPTYLNP